MVVIAATGDPAHLLPPLAQETVARDIGDQVFERLADLAPGGAPIDETAYRPALAASWERVDSLTWRFHLRPDAVWQDGRPVTAEDVRFSFGAFADSVVDNALRPYLTGITVVPEDVATVLIRFAEPSAEQLYDATFHVRILPSHIWAGRPPSTWGADTSVADLVGSGPYRVAEWKRGEFVRLAADTTAAQPPRIRFAIWRFVPDPEAAINLVLSHEADLLETAGSPDQQARVARDSALRLVPYPSAAYGFLGFQIAGGPTGGPHPVFADAPTRRALAQAVDRETLARSTFGGAAKAPPGPMSQLLWIWSDSIHVLPFDTVQADRALDAAGWRYPDSATTRQRGSRALSFDILVPSTSATKRHLGAALQAMWQAVGAAVTVTAVDFPVYQDRLRTGEFDSYIGAWLDEPSTRRLTEQWTRAGWGALNYGHYNSPAFDRLLRRAEEADTPAKAGPLYREAMDTLNSDVPAIFLYAPTNVAVVARRLEGVEIDPYGWISGLRRWSARR
ncbi:MAG: peptide ABC transporter substrate-binding protein [Gemmatimonadales bacterium]